MEQLLHVELEASSDTVVVTVTGEVDMSTAGLLADRMHEAHRLIATPRAVIVDLTRVRLLAAAGVTALLSGHLACQTRGVPLWVVAPNRFTRRTLYACGLESALHVVARSPAATAARLRSALESRALVDNAVGTVMAGSGVDKRRALAVLNTRARRENVSVPEVALRTVSTLPDRATGTSSTSRGSTSAHQPKLKIDLVVAAWEAESVEFRAHMSDLSTALSRQGHRVTLFVRRASPDFPEVERTRAGYDVVRVAAGPPTRLSKATVLPHLDDFASQLDRKWDDHVPDIVHLHSWLSGLAVHDSEAPLVQSFHGLKLVEDAGGAGNRKVKDLERMTALAADHVVAASSSELSGLVRNGVPRARTSLVSWGVDVELFNPVGPTAPRGDEPRVLALGEVSPRSGFRTAIEAVAAVPDVELVIAGPVPSPVVRNDPEVIRLVQHAREHGVADRVRFTGRVNHANLAALLRSADVAVRVPWHEPAGVSALQAMACGVPLLASKADALTDIVIDDLTGILVPPGDATALGQALRDLLADPTRRDIYATTSVDRAQTRYSRDRVTAELVAAYLKTSRAPRVETPAR